jgi:glycosyltransferase involved in cell wall biosynthesis
MAKENLPLVTIGVCVRNAASTIREAIESIIAQDYPHELMEVIFVDDGSKDETLSIIKKYAAQMDVRARLFQHEWQGLGYSRNIVVENASGKYIIWVDGDMILLKDHVRKQVEFMEKHPEVAVGKGKCVLYNEHSIVAYLEDLMFIMEFSKDRFREVSKPLGTGGAIYRCNAIKEIGGFNQKFGKACEDIDVEAKMRNAGWLLCITPATFYERRRSSWKSLWYEYFWHGFGAYTAKDAIKYSRSTLYRFFPLIAFLILFNYSADAYKKFRTKRVFLLPFHWFFKRTGWLMGFLIAYFNSKFKHLSLSKF